MRDPQFRQPLPVKQDDRLTPRGHLSGTRPGRLTTRCSRPGLRDESPLALKARIPLARTLATAARPKPALDLLARLLAAHAGDITVHTLDLDLLLVDHASPSTVDQRDDEPICWVTLGLVRESLFWATGREYDIAEIACRATGAWACEFHVKTG